MPQRAMFLHFVAARFVCAVFVNQPPVTYEGGGYIHQFHRHHVNWKDQVRPLTKNESGKSIPICFGQ
eukprot:4078970-Amphidinium_carterae.1